MRAFPVVYDGHLPPLLLLNFSRSLCLRNREGARARGFLMMDSASPGFANRLSIFVPLALIKPRSYPIFCSLLDDDCRIVASNCHLGYGVMSSIAASFSIFRQYLNGYFIFCIT